MNALWMLLACFLFASMGACVKLVGSHFNVGQTVLVRGLLPILILGGWVCWQRYSLRSAHWRSHLYRSLAGGLGMLMYFGAIASLPLATAVTLNNSSALCMALILALHQQQRPPRHILLALSLGLAGVIMVLQPAFSQAQWLGGVLGLCSAFLGAVAHLNLRELGRAGEPEWRTVFIFSCVTSLLALPLALSLPSSSKAAALPQWFLLLGVGLCGGAGQLALTRAFRSGRAIVTASMGYTTVLFSSLYGVLVWGERLSPLSWLGMAAIVLAGLISARPASRAPADAADGKPR
jgi:drug/metabolite transporter (DMT)-like permease